MYNILIVDDMQKVVHGIAYDIPWRDTGISEVYKAYSAKQALSVMESRRIDVVITDIRMPGMSGLDFIREIKARWRLCRVIIFSGYDEFEYAQQAIGMGVHSFLTKPVPYDQLTETVASALSELRNELEQSDIIEAAQRQIRDTLPIRKEHLLRRAVVNGRFELIAREDMQQRYGLRLDSGMPFLVLLLQCDEWLGSPDLAEQELNEVAFRYMAQDILCPSEQFVECFADYEGNLVIIVQRSTTEELKVLLRTIKGVAELLQHTVERKLQGVVSLFYNAPTSRLEDLPREYAKLKALSTRRLALPQGIITGIEFDERQHPQATDNRSESHLPDLQDYASWELQFRQGPEQLHAALSELFRHVDPARPGAYEQVLGIYHMVSYAIIRDSLARRIPVSDWAGEDSGSLQGIDTCRPIGQVHEQLTRITEKYYAYVRAHESGQVNQLVQGAVAYIYQNYHQDISVSDIAGMLYLHPNYLSRLFKKKTGQSISDFIIRLRIERAKTLLAQEDKKVYEVAHEVGYESVPHFQTIFRKWTGVSPKEYQGRLEGRTI